MGTRNIVWSGLICARNQSRLLCYTEKIRSAIQSFACVERIIFLFGIEIIIKTIAKAGATPVFALIPVYILSTVAKISSRFALVTANICIPS